MHVNNATGVKKDRTATSKVAYKLKKDITQEVQSLLIDLCVPENFSPEKPSDILGDVTHSRVGCGISDIKLSFIKNPQIIIFRTLARERIPYPHIDGTNIKGVPHYFSINVPLKGCDHGDFIFYQQGIESGFERHQQWKDKYAYHTWRPYNNNKLSEIERIRLTDPYIINPSVFHHVDNSNNRKDRYIAAIRHTDKFPTWEEALNEFGYLIDE